MIPELRADFNKKFSDDKYSNLLSDIREYFGCDSGFRIAETPVFMPGYLKERLMIACDEIMVSVMSPEYLEKSYKAIPDEWRVLRDSRHPEFVVADFAVTMDEEGLLKPMLIEIQGFPSVFFFQIIFDRLYRNVYQLPVELSPYFTGMGPEAFTELLRKVIMDGNKPEEVIILELDPLHQATYIDFAGAEKALGIKTICVRDIIHEGKCLYYMNNGQKQHIKRIFNRVIADDWAKRPDLNAEFRFTEDIEVSWAGHPNWFFRLSKYSMPYLKSDYVPETRILSEIKEMPADLENYVLKPLFSFSGSGVIFNVTKEDIERVDTPADYILQKKVVYHPGIVSPDEPVKCEIRVMLVWPDDAEKPYFTTNLTRLSKGDLIGVKFNKNKSWVGASLTYFSE